MKKLQYICVQPRLIYYAWQVEVMINNFIRNGINPNDINILVAWNPNDLTNSEENIKDWKRLYERYSDVRFFEYEDIRQLPIHYISSVRPNILKQHFLKYPELSNEVFFYHDCDVVFTKPIDFSELLNDTIWYLSDTNSYINYDYIKSKDYGVYEEMCRIVGIDEELPKRYNEASGGAQYIMKNLTSEYWEKVERDSEELFKQITDKNNRIKQQIPFYHELQIWCADMWAVLWNAWLFGHETKVVSELNFCWATDTVDMWDKCNIFHNAGVTNDSIGYFYKSNYMNKQPYNININNFDAAYCSYKYTQEIIKTIEVSCLK
jgi:hypothetical protein